MERLGILFGSAGKLKLIKLFIFNPEWQLTKDDIAEKAKLSTNETRRTLNLLVKMGLVKLRKKKVSIYFLNQEFEYLEALRDFLHATAALKDKDIISRLSRAGRLRMVVTAGAFLQDLDGRVDIMVVGDNLRQNIVESAIRSIEADMGRELKYVIFETDDFKYRYGLYDKLIRDILDFSHYTMLDKIGVMETTKEPEVEYNSVISNN